MPFRKKANEKEHKKKREHAYKLLEEIDEQPSAPQRIIITEEKIVKEEIKMINCSYCGALMESASVKCPHCGAPRRK